MKPARASAVPSIVARRGVATGLSLLGDSLLYAVLPSRPELAGLALSEVGLALSANRWIRLATNPFAGRVIDRVGAARPFWAALLLAAATTAAYGLGGGVAALIAARCGWGLAWSFLRIGGLDGVLQVGAPAERGRLMGWLQALSRGGSLISVALGGWLVDTIGYRETCLAFSAATLLALPLVPPRGPGAERRPAAPAGTAPAPAAPGRGKAGAVPEPVDAGLAWGVYAGVFATGFIASGVITGMAGQVVRALAETPGAGGLAFGAATLTGWLIALRWAVDLALAPRLGGVADRLGRRRAAALALAVGAPAVGGMVGVHAAVAAGWLAPAAAFGAVAACMLLAFMASTTLFTVFDAAVGDLAQAGRRGRVLGLYNNSLDVGAAAGPLCGFWIAERAGLPAAFGAGLLVWAAAVGWYVARAGGPGARARWRVPPA